MKKILLLLLCLGLVGCVHYTPKERAAIYGIRHGDNTVLSTMTNEELDILEAKVLKEQTWLNAFSAGARGFGESVVSDVREMASRQQYKATYQDPQQAPTYQTPQREPEYKPAYQTQQREPTFNDGYRDGYRDGYQYAEGGGIKSIAPISPIPPIPNIGETTYKDGYTRGIIDGQRLRKREGF